MSHFRQGRSSESDHEQSIQKAQHRGPGELETLPEILMKCPFADTAADTRGLASRSQSENLTQHQMSIPQEQRAKQTDAKHHQISSILDGASHQRQGSN